MHSYHHDRLRWQAGLVLNILVAPFAFLAPAVGRDQDTNSPDSSSRSAVSQLQTTEENPFDTRWVRGQVGWFAETLERRYGVKSVDEARQRMLALDGSDGVLYPLVEDIRGRAFRRDERLRGISVELFVRQYRGSPALQVIRIFELREDGKYEVDYWCDICAITMFELKPCDCCQGAIELRRRKTSAKKKS